MNVLDSKAVVLNIIPTTWKKFIIVYFISYFFILVNRLKLMESKYEGRIYYSYERSLGKRRGYVVLVNKAGNEERS